MIRLNNFRDNAFEIQRIQREGECFAPHPHFACQNEVPQVRHFAFCFVAFFTDYPCAADTFVKRIQIGSCDTEWAHITNVLYLHQTSGYWFLSHSAPQHKRAHVPCKLCLCPITVLYVGQMNSRDIHACKLTSLKRIEFQELLHQAHKAIATR